ncbi:MAG: hypothetical protein QG602_2631, partial [Verrucomicrobiota bacterium]|nr:hypothetical protein [Verrucomicrobiota bacterium]
PPDDNADLRAEPHSKVRPDSLVMPGLVSGC